MGSAFLILAYLHIAYIFDLGIFIFQVYNSFIPSNDVYIVNVAGICLSNRYFSRLHYQEDLLWMKISLKTS